VVRVQIEAGHWLCRSQGHPENKLCDPSVAIDGDSYRMRSHRARAQASRRAVAAAPANDTESR